MNVFRRLLVALAIPAVLIGLPGCSSKNKPRIRIDGSSTVEPITSAVAEKFMNDNPDIVVNVGTSGTGGGFKKFLSSNPQERTDINDASRPIKQVEIDKAKEEGIEYVELKVAVDGLSVVVHPDNTWCDALTVDALKQLWVPDSNIATWKQLGETLGQSDWPAEEIKLYGPGPDSGTFDYFTEEICGEKGYTRNDYQASENDNDLVRGVSQNKYALGYFGFAYYMDNRDKLRAVKIAPPGKSLDDAVAPSFESVEAGRYVPLSRPLFVYVRKEALGRPEVQKFLRYYLHEDKGQKLVRKVDYVKLSETELKKSQQKLEEAIKSLDDSNSK